MFAPTAKPGRAAARRPGMPMAPMRASTAFLVRTVERLRAIAVNKS